MPSSAGDYDRHKLMMDIAYLGHPSVCQQTFSQGCVPCLTKYDFCWLLKSPLDPFGDFHYLSPIHMLDSSFRHLL